MLYLSSAPLMFKKSNQTFKLEVEQAYCFMIIFQFLVFFIKLLFCFVLFCFVFNIDKPLEVKTIHVKKSSALTLGDFVGESSGTKRNDGKTDIILKFNGESFIAHKHVLRAASELFEKVGLIYSGSTSILGGGQEKF